MAQVIPTRRVKQLSDTIYLYSNQNGSFFIGKEIVKCSYKRWEEEINILQKVGNIDNVVNVYPNYSKETDHAFTIFMEPCDASLYELIYNENVSPATAGCVKTVKARDYFEGVLIKELLCQSAKGLKHLHVNGIVHRDLKPNNILLTRASPSRTVAKLSDFGFSREIPSGFSSLHSVSVCTKAYLAKECYDQRWKTASDIFSLGAIIFEAMTKVKPFGKKDDEIECNVKNEKPPNFQPLRSSNASYIQTKEEKITMIDMLKRMLCHKPEARLLIDDVLHHPTFYSSKKKADYLLKIRDNLCKIKSKRRIENNLEFLKEINQFDMGLFREDRAGKMKSFDIHEKYLPLYLTWIGKEQQVETIKTRFLVGKCRNVETWLNVFRNQIAHAVDPGQPKQLYLDYGVDGDSFDHEKIIGIFLKRYPQLLVHLYEKFRNRNVGGEFYPTASVRSSNDINQSATSSDSDVDLLEPWEEYFKDKGIKGDRLYDYHITAKYNGDTVSEDTYQIRERGIKVFHPNYEDKISENIDSEKMIEFRLPRGKGVILTNCLDGIIFETDPDSKNLFAIRRCNVQVFYRSQCQPSFIKMKTDVKVPLFSYESLFEKFQSGENMTETARLNMNQAEFIFGKNPNSTPSRVYPVTLTVISMAITKVLHQKFERLDSGEVLLSRDD